MTMLQLVLKLRPPTHSAAIGLIARELALDIAEAVYCPDVAEHVPGIANVTADLLSRKHEPDSGWSIPVFLHRVPEMVVPQRSDNYFRSI